MPSTFLCCNTMGLISLFLGWLAGTGGVTIAWGLLGILSGFFSL
jgi:hypothetical protein